MTRKEKARLEKPATGTPRQSPISQSIVPTARTGSQALPDRQAPTFTSSYPCLKAYHPSVSYHTPQPAASHYLDNVSRIVKYI